MEDLNMIEISNNEAKELNGGLFLLGSYMYAFGSYAISEIQEGFEEGYEEGSSH